MLSRSHLFEYQAWPSERMPHLEALHHMFGRGISEIRTDTYILSPHRPDWLMIVRGGTHFEIKVKTAVQEPLTAWTIPVRSAFPLPRHVVLTLHDAFPMSELPQQIFAPVDLLSWLGPNASICTVSQRMVHLEDGDCAAELTQVNAHGRRVETFCLSAKRYEPLVEILKMIPGPRLPNWDYGIWLQHRILETPPIEIPAALRTPQPEADAAPSSPVEKSGLYRAASLAEWSAWFQKAVRLGRDASAQLRQWRAARSPAPEPAEGALRLTAAANDDEPCLSPQAQHAAMIGEPVKGPMALSTRFRISKRQKEWPMTASWRCSGESMHVESCGRGPH